MNLKFIILSTLIILGFCNTAWGEPTPPSGTGDPTTNDPEEEP
jgi:hypothetical protein